MTRRTIVLGDSHTHCMWAAAQKWPDRSEGISIYRLGRPSDAKGGQPVLSWDEARDMVKSLEPTVPLFLSIGGTLHNRASLLAVGPEFDFALHGNDSPSEGKALIPRRAISNWFEQEIDGIEQIKKLRSLAKGDVYLLAPPPPKQSGHYLAERASRRHDGGARALSVRPVAVSPSAIRLKFYRLEQQLMGDWAERNGIRFLPCSEQVENGEGFLARRLYGVDMTHANKEFGLLRLQEIARIAAREVEIHG